VQAGPAQLLVLFDHGGLQAQLSGAKGRGVSGRSAADDGYVINGVWQVRAPILLMMNALVARLVNTEEAVLQGIFRALSNWNNGLCQIDDCKSRKKQCEPVSSEAEMVA
jgi:hypothetical protein